MSKLTDTPLTDYIFDQEVPFSKDRYKQIIEESKELLISPLRTMALLIAVAGIFAMIFEARHFAGFSVQIYLTRLSATIISFGILVLLNTRYGIKYSVYLVHALMVVIIFSSGYMIYLLPQTLVLNSHLLGLIIFVSALFLSWEVKQQVIMVLYYNVVFGASVLLNEEMGPYHPGLLESILFVIFLSIVSVIGSAVSFRLRLQLAEKSFRVQLSEKKFKAIFDNSAEGIFQTTPDGRFLTANDALIKILGYDSREELMHADIKEIYFDPEDRVKLLSKIKKEEEIKNYVTKLKKKDGSPVFIKLNDRLVTDEDNSRIYFEGSLTDITEQVKADEQRRKTEELLRLEKERSDKLAREAQELNLIKSQFLANMSHEIRTPMNGIIGYLTLIDKEAYETTEELRQFALSAKDSADVLLDIINNILDLSKIESGKMEIINAPFSLPGVIEDAISIVSSKAAEKKLKLSSFIEKGIPVNFSGDGTRLRQIFINLLSNAIKFTETGEVKIFIDKRREVEDKLLLRFVVEDTGVGISKENIDSLFQPFSQIDSSPTRKYGGTGLGLAICKEFVHMMGGEIHVESEVGKGSRFIFEIALKKLSDIEEYIEKKEMKTEENKKYRILLTEDNVINQKIALRMLSHGPYIVDTAVTGTEALEKLSKNPFDLVLMDIQMPDMDGFMVTSEIRKSDSSYKNIPIIAITAHALIGDREKCINAGMDDYLTKPILSEELIRKINSLLNITVTGKPAAENFPSPIKSRIFDFNHLNNMSVGETGFRNELIQTFIEDLTNRIKNLEVYLETKDYVSIGKEAHTIKGAGSSVGATEIASLALAVEISARANDIQNAARNFVKLTAAVGETKDLLKNSGMIS
jgi:PAS domain S-box-containing protein